MAMTDELFPDFESHWIDTSAGRIFARSKGDGEPLVLLHGFPQTHVMWHHMAGALVSSLACSHRVVLMDLRGYGWSSAPRSKHGEFYTKSRMGEDVVEVMSKLGHAHFGIIGHDRGARVGYRLALEEPGRVARLALLDIMPTIQVWRNINAGLQASAHWEFLSRNAPVPEAHIEKDPNAYFEGLMVKWAGDDGLRAFDSRAMQAYRNAWGDPSRIHAFCEDYRAGATDDLQADERDLAAGKTIRCPVQCIWGSNSALAKAAKPVDQIWRETFAPKALGASVEAGHFVAEENAAATLDVLLNWLAAS